MTNRSVNEGQHERRIECRWLLQWLPILALVLGLTAIGGISLSASAAEAANNTPVLQAVDISPLSGNRLQVRFRLSEAPKNPPSSFTINDPARIVLDFLETRNGLSTRQQSINVGVADRISVLEGADRTRASLNLARLVPYNVQVQGNSVLLTLDNAGTAAAKTPAATPAASVAAAASATPRRIETPLVASRSIQDVSFRRGPNGQGVITTKLSNPGIAVDVRQEGNQIIADFQGANLPRGQQRRLDVTDFATPVRTVEALNRGNSARLNVQPTPPFEYLAYQANDLYVIEVRPPQQTPEEEEKETMFDSSKKKYKGDLLSLNFQDIEVRAILQILADFTGLNIVVSDSVKGNLTLRLQNVPWDQALDIILRTKGLAMRQNGNVVFIAPTEEVAAREKLDLESHKTVQELIPLRTEIIQVNYAKAGEIAKLLENKGGGGGDKTTQERGILSPRGDIVPDERTNTLIVKDVPDKLVEVRELVAKLDVPSRQVLIDSRVVIASNDFSRDLGAKFGVTGVQQAGGGINAVSGSTTATDAMVNSAINNLTSTGQSSPVAVPTLLQNRIGVDLSAAGTSLAFAILRSDYLVDLELSALQAEGQGEVVSNPKVVTADLKKATILQGRQIPYTTVSQDGTKIEWKDVFLKLEVTPQITPDDRVRMDLLVSKDEEGRQVTINSLQSASIDKREVSTQVMVNNGETVVLGGVFEQSKTDNVSKVPLLGDVPLLGYFFRNTKKGDTKRELLIFVTPQILKNSVVAER